MRIISYDTYFDKVYGCFLGKCIGGTAGGPAEGRKELLDFPLNEELLHSALPNDDLDLQIVWLELLEERGADITARDMAKAFYEKVPYGPGEYGYFKKNYGRGIYPPTSGWYNNRYYKDGMGCPIRSEIWACLFPGAPESARPYVLMDGSLDHEHDSIEAEYFLTVMETEAFFESDLRRVIERGLAVIEAGSRLQSVLCDTVRLFDEGRDWKFTREYILGHYGHPDCTNMYQNMAFILLSLLYGGGDMRETIRLGIACGYDTDCICASAASVLGALLGGDRLLRVDGFTDTGLCIEVLTRRRDGSIRKLAEDVCAAGMSMIDRLAANVQITGRPDFTPLPVDVPKEPFTVEAVYEGEPVLVCGRETRLSLRITSHIEAGEILLALDTPQDVEASLSATRISLQKSQSALVAVTARMADGAARLAQKNIFTLTLAGAFGEYRDTFGLVGGDIWYRYGPFLMNNKDLTHIPPHEKYNNSFPLSEGEERFDVLRDFHLNNIARIDHAFVPETELFTAIDEDGRAACIPQRVCLTEDLFDLTDFASFTGPHVEYLIRYVESPEDRTVELAVGHTAPFRLWINGKYIGGSDECAWWTGENKHYRVTFRAGENIMILKCAQISDSAKYSLIPRIVGGRWRHWEDFASLLHN